MNNSTINNNVKEIMKKFHIDHATKTIIIPKNIAKKASTYGTDEYQAFLEIQRDFSNYEVKVREVKRPTSRKESSDGLKGLTFGYIEKYLAAHGNKEQKDEYALLRNPVHDEGAESKQTSYVEIRKWFLKTFPQVLDYQKKVDEILARKAEAPLSIGE